MTKALSLPFFANQLKGLALVAGFLLLLDWGFKDALDLWLADQMFDFVHHTFPVKGTWFADVFMHQWLKQAMIISVLGLAIWLSYELRKPREQRSAVMIANLKIIVLTAITLPLLIGALKYFSPIHCPWDLARYGGHATLDRIGFAPDGRCFPAGHVTSTSWLLAFTLFFLPSQRGLAWKIFALTFMVAFYTGWIQQLRGAHFLCHTLWSLWISWAVIVGLAFVFRRPESQSSAPMIAQV